jgi:hypothetical protein
MTEAAARIPSSSKEKLTAASFSMPEDGAPNGVSVIAVLRLARFGY